MTAVPCLPLHQCLQHSVKDKQKQMPISNQHFRVPRWRAFNFAQVPFRRMLGILKFKNMYAKVQFSGKKIVHQLGFELPTLILKSLLFYQLHNMYFLVCNGMLLCSVFNPLQSANWMLCELVVINLKLVDNGFMVLSSWSLMSAVPGELSAWQTKWESNHRNFSFIYIYIDIEIDQILNSTIYATLCHALKSCTVTLTGKWVKGKGNNTSSLNWASLSKKCLMWHRFIFFASGLDSNIFGFYTFWGYFFVMSLLTKCLHGTFYPLLNKL